MCREEKRLFGKFSGIGFLFSTIMTILTLEEK